MADSNNNFYAYMSRLRHIRRWGLMRNTQPENVAEHTFQVAIVAHALCLLHNELYPGGKPVDEGETVLCALYHEAAEAITGDLPTPIKYYNDEIAGAYKQIEKQAEHSMLGMLPGELQPKLQPYVTGNVDEQVRRIVKAADRICAYTKCLEERKGGNTEFEFAAQRILESIRSMHLPEADYFLDNFVDAYEKTLDELNM